MATVRLVFTWTFTIILFIPSLAYRTYYVEDTCLSKTEFQKVVYNVPANGVNSIGELRTNRFGTYSRIGRTCLLKLVPPSGHGIVVSVHKVDFRNHEDCKDFIKIFTGSENEKLCGYIGHNRGSKTYFSDEEMKILYHTENAGLGFNDGFRIMFTVAKRADGENTCKSGNEFKCANSRCIWAGATCDGHNNCGDWSDESTDGYAFCPNLTPVAIAVISFAITLFVMMLIAICFCCCRSQKTAEGKVETDFPLRPNAGYIPLPGYIYAERAPSHIMQETYHSMHPTAPKRTMYEDGSSNFQLPISSSPLDLPPPYKP